MSDGSNPAASAAAEVYAQRCSDFHTKPIQAIIDALISGEEELKCCPRADQVAPLIAALASLPGPAVDLTFTDAPEVAYAAEAIATAFLYTERIKMVACSLGGAGIVALARGLTGLERSDEAVCSVLDLSQNGLQAQDIGKLVPPLMHAVPTLQALNVELNPLGSDGARALCPLIAPPPATEAAQGSASHTASLRVLSLRGCGVHDGGVSALSSALVQGRSSQPSVCSALRVLDLSDNPVCSSGIVVLCAALTSQLSINVAAQRAGAAASAVQDAPGVVELLLREVKCDAGALRALAGLLLATADVHKQFHSTDPAVSQEWVPGLQYLDLTGVAAATHRDYSSGTEEANEYTAGVLNLLHACQTLVASSSGAVQMDGLAQLQVAAEELHGSDQALRVVLPTTGAARDLGDAEIPEQVASQQRPVNARWGAIMQRLQGATQTLAEVHSAAQGVKLASKSSVLARKLYGGHEAIGDLQPEQTQAQELPDGIPPALAAYIQEQVQQAAKQLRAELDSDVGTLLSEVAATSARVDRLEEVVRAEQQASMQLLESLMSMQDGSE